MINVMVIEDRMLTLDALKTQVHWEQYELNPVGFFLNCREAMKYIDELKPDVIVTDIIMSGMDGLSFCEYVNGLERNIKIIIVSAYSKFEFAKKGIQLGIYDFLEKPIDYEELAEQVQKAGRIKKHEEQIKLAYEDKESFFRTLFWSNDNLENHTWFDCIEKELEEKLASIDYMGIETICAEMSNYVKMKKVKKDFLLFWGMNFFSKKVMPLLSEEKMKAQIDLEKMMYMADAIEIIGYMEDVLKKVCIEFQKDVTSTTDYTVQQIKNYVEDNYKEELNLIKIASVFNMSPNYISRIFKEKTKVNLMEYVSDRKIREAKIFLRKTDMSIYEISRELNYSSQYYFCNVFKKKTGYSPKEYRNVKMNNQN